jgi:PAS domain S-box-containing protein
MVGPALGDTIVPRVADLLPVGIWVARVPDGALLYANDEFTRIMGMAARDDVARGEWSVPYGIYDRQGELYKEEQLPFVRALRARDVVTVDDIVIHRSDGAHVNIRAQARPVFDARGEVECVVIAFIDITREVHAEAGRLESEARLMHAQKLESVGTLAGGVAHDFNNLLSAAQVLVEMLKRSDDDPTRLAQLAQLGEVVTSATKLTRALLDFARHGKPTRTAVNLNDVAHRVAELSRRTMDKRIEIVASLDPSEPVVVGDASQLEQVVMNLLLNSRDAMPEGGKIALSTRVVELDAQSVERLPPLPPGTYAELSVVDSGPGILPEHRARVFEPYFTTKVHPDSKGTGLGLAMVYGIIEAHRGAIEVADAKPRGAHIRAYLPVAPRELVPSSRVAASAPRVGQGTILVVDDDRLVLDAACGALRSLGYEALAAQGGQEAIETLHARKGTIDGVLLDLMMPEPDGAATLDALRAIDAGVRVLVATAGNLADDARYRGVCGFLSKPYSLGALSEAIAHLTSDRADVLRL